MHCSRVFRSSAPSDSLPSSPCGRPSGTAHGEYGGTRSMEWGVGPGGGVPHRGCCPAGKSPARHIPEGTLPGSVRFQGRVARCVSLNRPHVLLDCDECAPRGQQAPVPQAQLPQVALRQVPPRP